MTDTTADDAKTGGESDSSEAESPDAIENLVITARRRPELLQETPVAATVLGGELLEQRGIDSLEEIGTYVPNLTAFSGVQQGTFIRAVSGSGTGRHARPGRRPLRRRRLRRPFQGALLPTLDLSAWRSCAARRARSN